MDELQKKSLLIEQLKQQNERVLNEKNQDINRLELGKKINEDALYIFFFLMSASEFRTEIHFKRPCQLQEISTQY